MPDGTLGILHSLICLMDTITHSEDAKHKVSGRLQVAEECTVTKRWYEDVNPVCWTPESGG